MEKKKNEIRTLECGLSVREVSQNAEGNPVITGRAIVFNTESQVLDDWGMQFKEIILPECCTQEFINAQDIKLNLLHERELTIGRWNKGVGSLRLTVKPDGLYFEIEANTSSPVVQHAVAMIREKTYTGCSFEFYPEDYEVVDGEPMTITHRRFARITAITIGMDPAYTATSVNVRECMDKKKEVEEYEKKMSMQEPDDEKKPEDTEEAECKKKEQEAECKKNEEREARNRQIALMRMDMNNY